MVDPQIKSAVDESFRRKAGLGGSSAGIGAQFANSVDPTNPLAINGQTPQTPQQPSGGANGAPTDGAMGAVKQQKGEAQKLTDTMMWRLKKLTERGE